jgi:hypothetical protein
VIFWGPNRSVRCRTNDRAAATSGHPDVPADGGGVVWWGTKLAPEIRQPRSST